MTHALGGLLVAVTADALNQTLTKPLLRGATAVIVGLLAVGVATLVWTLMARLP